MQCEPLEVVDTLAWKSANPALVTTHATLDDVYGVAVSGDFICAAEWIYGLEVIRIAEPTVPPAPASSLYPGSSVGSVAVAGDYAYLANFDRGLTIFDISSPNNPNEVRTVDTGNESVAVAVR